MGYRWWTRAEGRPKSGVNVETKNPVLAKMEAEAARNGGYAGFGID